MNIIFVTIAYPRTSGESNLYSDLMDEFAEHGHHVFVACSIEKRYKKETNLSIYNGINVLRVQTGNITSNPNYISKGIALFQLQSQLINAIDQYFTAVTFDLILYSTPPIQYNRIIKYLKTKSNATTYLLLKDIFPQNAVDIGLISKRNPIYWYFKQKEKETYLLSDTIGCMSPANVRYLLNHNPYLISKKVEVCVNSIKNRGIWDKELRRNIRAKIRQTLSIQENELLLIYGGNLGISQGIPFFMEIIKAFHKQLSIKFLIVGEGTWYTRIAEFLIQGGYNNVILQQRVLPTEFREMLYAADIGLIFLNPRFTIPNFPSRLTSYLEAGLPVIACTDPVTDIGDIIQNEGCGYKVLSGDIDEFQNAVSNLVNSPGMLSEKSVNARKLFEKEYTTSKSYSVIMNHIKE